MDIITVGELVIDFLPGNEEGSYIRNAGGAPANVAIAAVRNGVSAGIFCKVGDDDFGRFLMKTLDENGVKALSPELCEEAVTTMAFVTLDENHDRSFTFARKPGADMMLDVSEIDVSEIARCKVLHAGSCSLSAGKAAEATVFALEKAHEAGRIVSFDVNYRNLMWKDDAEACAEKVREILPFVDLLKISEEEERFVGGRENISALMKEYDVACVVETLGASGAQLYYGDQSVFIPGFVPGKVVDTTGAGDAFWGGFLSSLLNGGVSSKNDLTLEKLEEAVRYGNAAGSLAVAVKGAIPALPDRKQIEEVIIG